MTNTSTRPGERGAPATISGKDAGTIARASFVGTALEWYDYYLFGTAAALVFNRLYFTTMDPTAALLASFATFGVGFAARPIGAILFGYIGDKFGRRPALLATIVMIGIATGLIGLLPDFGSIGLAAPILLAVLRLVQGLAVGGEWGGAVTMAIEHAPVEKRGRFAALVQVGSPVGTLLSSAAFSLVLLFPSETFDAWGWRIPFLMAFPLLLIALWIRIKVEESPIFKDLLAQEETSKVPALDVFRNAGGRLAVAVMAALLGVGGFYMITTFIVSYGSNTLGVDRQVMVNATLIAAVAQIFVTIAMGRLSEKIGPGKVTMWGGILTAVAAFPIFAMVDTKSTVMIMLAITIGIVLIAVAYAVNGALLTELFPPKLRYSGVALGYNIAGATSGFMPLLATAMLGFSGNQSWGGALILAIIALITAVGGFLGERLRVQDKRIVSAD
ncbi:MFS transporter [Arthrobacter koreensis]|uniref:MHS family MFS transporter n=1 Tax=Arthrobacter koreensis TaxID=199136 RepID=A0ABY6FRK2_9MICC|nr:MFS transporter [Arthrobacter koreensis]MDF2496500.1 transporter [Arthrobacter koreensis]MEB7446784.1 MHS family MFS transporter [Arthrobacter koreensis]UYB35845.1 MHS family MFS transporter [Arthrobacter koreensis]